MLRPDRTTLELGLDSVALPGEVTVAVAAGIEDAAGNASAALGAQPIAGTDETAPVGVELTAATVEGAANDLVAVRFDDDMLSAEVEDLTRWTIESPLGTPFDVTGASVTYNPDTTTATVTLSAGSEDENLSTFTDIHVALNGMRDLGGNALEQTFIGTTAISAMVGGDVAPPAALAAAPGAGEAIVVTFSEALAVLTDVDQKSASNPAGIELELTDMNHPGERATGSITISDLPTDGDIITLSDGNVTRTFEFDAAQGSITLSGLPNDGDSVSINDGTVTTTFEFDNGGGVAGGAVSVPILGTVGATVAMMRDVTTGTASARTRAIIGSSADQLLLFSSQTGTLPNQPLVATDTAGVITLVGMSGGGDTSDRPVNINPRFVWANASNLNFAINLTSSFDISSDNVGGTELVTLQNDNRGTAGNVTIQINEMFDVIDAVGMSGGLGVAVRAIEPLSLSASSIQAVATFEFAPEIGDTLRLYGVRDLAGNQMTPELVFGVSAANVNPPAFDGAGPDLIAVSGASNDTISVGFDLDLHPEGLEDLSNYALTGPDGGVDLTGATVEQTDADTLVLTLQGAPQLASGATYTFSATGLVSRQGVPITIAESAGGLLAGGDVDPPAAVDARMDPATTNAILVQFSEAVDPAGATDVANYAIAGLTAVSATQVHPRAVRVVFSSGPEVADQLEVQVAALTDLAGNAVGTGASVAITGADETAPLVTMLDPSNAEGVHRFMLSFDGPMQPGTVTTPANYSVEVAGLGALSLEGASFEHDAEANVVTITLGEGVFLPTGETLEVTATGVFDLAGNAIVPAAASATIQGDSAAPTAATAFVDLQADATESTIEVVFPEAMNAQTTLQLSNWMGSNGQSALTVMARGDRRFRVAFDAPIAAADTITVTAPTDAALNVGTNLVLDPIE